MPRTARALVAVLLFACGDPKKVPPGAAPDAAPLSADAASADATPDDAAPSDATVPCEPPPSAPVRVVRSVRYCAGEVSLGLGVERAAVVIAASGVRVECEGTIFVGSDQGSTADPTAGFLIEDQADVELAGCGARGFRYGLIARRARSLRVEGARFDDNFHDPLAGWVQDSVQGGGLRLEAVEGATVSGSSFARNWNGVELRESRGVVVRANRGDHCSNTGATLVATQASTLRDNDLSFAIRGDGLSFPDRWYGVDTRDSAGIIIDASSSHNRVLRNDVRFGGDGVFIRSVIGRCATDNVIEANDARFSPHNAIECWCDRNHFLDNDASDSDYGLWLGGGDDLVVRGNRAQRNRVDGVSIQIGEDRRLLLEANEIHDNGRTGVLLTGREIQAWHTLDHVGPALAASSGLLLQENRLSGNGPCAPYTDCDVFVAASRGVVLASNCGAGGGPAAVSSGLEVEGLWGVGGCGAAGGQRPVAALAPVSAALGADVVLDASASRDPEGHPLGFHWSIQPAGARFPGGALPPAVRVGPGLAQETVRFDAPGLYEIHLFADDGARADRASRVVAVAPAGGELCADAQDWRPVCTTPSCTTSVAADRTKALIGEHSVRVTTDEAFQFAISCRINADLSGRSRLSGFFLGANPNPIGWQGNLPVISLITLAGPIIFEPDASLLPVDGEEWVFVDLPLAGGQGWRRSGAGDVTQVTALLVGADTWDYRPYSVWIDGLTAY